MHCPRCQVQLQSVDVAELTIELCPRCEGSFYDFAELSRLFSNSERELRQSLLAATLDAEGNREVDLEAPAACPRCGEVMERQHYLSDCPVLVDQCPQHGFWLDDGELGKLMDHLAGTMGGEAEEVGRSGRIRNAPSRLFASLKSLFGGG